LVIYSFVSHYNLLFVNGWYYRVYRQDQDPNVENDVGYGHCVKDWVDNLAILDLRAVPQSRKVRAALKDTKDDKSHHPAGHDSQRDDGDGPEPAAVGFAENALAKEESTCFCECETEYR
jgi:hypothetical protein